MTESTCRQSSWVLTYRKSGRTRRFASLAEAKRVHVRAAARYGTRWLPKVMDTPPNTQLYTVRFELEVEAPTPEQAARTVRRDFPEFARFQFDIRDDEDQLLLLVDAEAAGPRLAKRKPTSRVFERTTFTDREQEPIDAEMARLATEEE